MNRNKLQLGIVFAILLVAYNICLFLINSNYHTSFWVSFIFIMVAYTCVFFAFMFVNSKGRKQQVVGMPVTVLSCLYFAIEFIMGTIFMCFNVSFVAVFVPQFILFALFGICFVPALLSNKNYKNEENK